MSSTFWIKLIVTNYLPRYEDMEYKFVRSHIESRALNWNKFMHILIANDKKKVKMLRLNWEKMKNCVRSRLAISNLNKKNKMLQLFWARHFVGETWSWLCLMATHLLLSFIYAVTSALSTRRVLYKSLKDFESFVRCVLYFLV